MELINKIIEEFYQSIIEEARYRYILEGLGRTVVIAFFAVILGVIAGTLIALIRN